MATEQEIAAKQAEWDALQVELMRANHLADLYREQDLMFSAATYDGRADDISDEMKVLEDWLIDAGAPGWVAT